MLKEDRAERLEPEAPMTIGPAEAWRKALNCTCLADKAADEIARKILTVIRDSWIAIANDGEVVGTTDPIATLLILDQSVAGRSPAIRSDPRCSRRIGLRRRARP